MGMRKAFRCVLAVALAAVTAAAPLSVRAGETENPDDLEDILEASAEGDGIGTEPFEGGITLEFGDGLYDLFSADGEDASWLKSAAAAFKMVPGDEMLSGMLSVQVNGTQIGHALIGIDTVTDMVYVSIPEYFDQTIAVSPEAFLDSVMSGITSGGAGGEDSLQSQMMQAAMNAGMEFVEELGDFFASVPADTWQQELMSYVMPVLSSVNQESTQETITAGSLSADVTVQTISIPSEKMGDLIKGTLTTLSTDQLVESLFKSDAVSDLCDTLSMISGSDTELTGEALLEQFRSAVKGVASADFSSVPGIMVKVMNSADGKAAGFTAALEAGGTPYELITFKAIQEGSSNAFSIVPGTMLLSMTGLDASGSVEILGQGNTGSGLLNEEVDLLVNGGTAAKLLITDLDLASAEDGRLNGTFRFEADGVSAQVSYSAEDDDAQTIEYLFNDKLFYRAQVYKRAATDDSIEEADLTNLAPVNSIEELSGWLGTFDAQKARELLAQAGIPAGTMAEEVPMTEDIAA